ncbi:MAG TPA: sugar phosphate isomerase/epimerase family protein [Dongiaceae bacterium]|jgi:sugar phosphate isomerase/epimerase|nr:sugar phosphate isomerase/epimerase family protein [Dongiaceae bacterium]
MRLGIFAKTFPGSDPHTVLAAVAEAGFAATQYNMACSGLAPMPDGIDGGTSDAVRAAAAANGVEIVALSGTFNMIHPDPAVREAGLRSLGEVTKAASRMGAPLVTLCTGTRDSVDQWRGHPDNARPEAWRDLLAGMARALDLAEAAGVDLGVEPELANVIDSAAAARRLIDEMASPRIKIVFDAANLFEIADGDERRRIISRGIGLLADRIALAHAKDRNADGSFATAGKGVLDYPHYLAELRRNGFDGPVITHGLRAEEASGVGVFLRAAMAAAL